MLNFNLPINNVSFGQVSSNILFELWKRKFEFGLLPLTQGIDTSAFSYPTEFRDFLHTFSKVEIFLQTYSKDDDYLKLWHIGECLENVGDPVLLTFHETSELTKEEANILKNLRGVIVTSKYTKEVFEAANVSNVHYVPLGFDSQHFKRVDKTFLGDDVITFGLFGKLEKRKAHMKVVEAWIKKYGNNPKYRLNCGIMNHFLVGRTPDEQKVDHIKAHVAHHLGDTKIPFNVNFLPHAPTNDVFNEYLNTCDIHLTGMSHCEGFNLPLFQALCIGKQAVVFNEHVHKDYCNENNAFLVPSNGKTIEAHDEVFFKRGSVFNQGHWKDWNEDDFIDQCVAAEKKAKEVNKAGKQLAYEFSYKKTVDGILKVFDYKV